MFNLGLSWHSMIKKLLDIKESRAFINWKLLWSFILIRWWELETSAPGTMLWNEDRIPGVRKETKPSLRGKWESVFSERHKDNVPKETLVDSVMTNKPLETVAEAKVRDKKDNRLLPHPVRDQHRLTARDKSPHRNPAINRKTQRIRVDLHTDSSYVKIRHVSSGILPCVTITSLKKVVYMATNATSEMLRQVESPARGRKLEAQKDQWPYWRSSNNWVVYLKKNYPRKSVPREPGKLGTRHAVTFSKGTWDQIKIRERKGPSQSIIRKCALHERSLCAPKFEERSYDETLTQERCARKAAWDLAKIFRSSRIRTKLRSIFLVKLKVCLHLQLQRDQKIENSQWIQEYQCTWWWKKS